MTHEELESYVLRQSVIVEKLAIELGAEEKLTDVLRQAFDILREEIKSIKEQLNKKPPVGMEVFNMALDVCRTLDKESSNQERKWVSYVDDPEFYKLIRNAESVVALAKYHPQGEE